VALTLSVEARPDPTLDPDVRGLNTAQAEAARRLTGTQIDAFSRRLEQLREGGAGSGFRVSLDGGAFRPLDEHPGQAVELRSAMGGGLSGGLYDARLASQADLDAIGASRASGASPSGPAGPAGGPTGRIRMWADGAIILGERDA